MSKIPFARILPGPASFDVESRLYPIDPGKLEVAITHCLNIECEESFSIKYVDEFAVVPAQSSTFLIAIPSIAPAQPYIGLLLTPCSRASDIPHFRS
jgi:hypothetical protein